MDIESAKFYFQVLQFLLTGGIGIYVYLSNKHTATNDRVGKMAEATDERLDNHSERITRLEGSAKASETAQRDCPQHARRISDLEAGAKHSPTHEDLGEMHEKINVVSGQLNTLTGEFSAVRRTLDLIHEYLLKGSK